MTRDNAVRSSEQGLGGSRRLTNVCGVSSPARLHFHERGADPHAQGEEKEWTFSCSSGSLASGYRRMSKTTGKASPRASGTSSPIGAALTKRRRGFQGAEVSHRASVARTKDPGTFLLSPCQTGLPGSVALAFYRGVQTDLGYFGPSSKGRIRLALLGANAHSSQSLS